MDSDDTRTFRKLALLLSIPCGPIGAIMIAWAYFRDLHRGLHPSVLLLIGPILVCILIPINSIRGLKVHFGMFGGASEYQTDFKGLNWSLRKFRLVGWLLTGISATAALIYIDIRDIRDGVYDSALMVVGGPVGFALLSWYSYNRLKKDYGWFCWDKRS